MFKHLAVLGFGLTLPVSGAFAASTEQTLQNLSGCFEVTFRYIEDGTHDLNLPATLEHISAEKKQDGLYFQHTLLVGNEPQKHWREEWRPQSDGLWEQTVIGPFEDFRYKCTAEWVMNQWSCDVAGTPKPRRDEARPYATLDRSNTLQLTPKGWVHVQRNGKRTQDGNLMSVEVGWNEYRRTDDARCAAIMNR